MLTSIALEKLLWPQCSGHGTKSLNGPDHVSEFFQCEGEGQLGIQGRKELTLTVTQLK